MQPQKPVKKLYSIGALLLSLYEESAVDVIIVAKLFDEVAAIISVKDGHVIPFGGEAIDSSENIRLKIIEIIETFGIGNLWTIGFGNYLYNDNDIIMKLRNVNSYFVQPTDEFGISLNNIWQHPKINSAIKNSQLLPVNDGYINKRNITIFFLIMFLCTLGIMAHKYFDNKVEVTKKVNSFMLPKVTSVPANDFVVSCFKDTNMYFGNLGEWQMSNLTCNLQKQIGTFSLMQTDFANNIITKQSLAPEGLMSQGKTLINILNTGLDNADKINDLNVAYKNSDVLISKTIKFKGEDRQNNNAYTVASNNSEIIANLEKLNLTDGITFTLDKQVVKRGTISNRQEFIKFKITSTLSPLWLVDNGFLTNQIYLTEVSAIRDSNTGYYTWSLSGELPK